MTSYERFWTVERLAQDGVTVALWKQLIVPPRRKRYRRGRFTVFALVGETVP
jgi:hypothetical protein